MKKDYASGYQKIVTLMTAIAISCLLNTNAQTWYDSAEYRIDTLRKGDFTLRITDELDNPVTDSVYIRLKKHEYQWGNTIEPIDQSTYSRWQQAVLQKYYNCGVAEEFKWYQMEGSQGNVNYAIVDTIYAWAARIGWDVRAHTLIWGGSQNWQMPGWTLNLTGEPLYNACSTRVHRDVAHYQGIIKEYDVINEPVHETWLYEQAGDSIKWNAFKWADEEDPDARLFVNEYNVIVWGSTADYVNTIQEMLDHGAPIDGIGAQGHMEGTLNWLDIKNKLDQLATLGLPIKVTEFDMKIDEQHISDQSMANSYGTMMRICFSHPAVEGLIWWGFKDPTYRNGSGIFDENKRPKIAADTVYHLIHEKWSTNISDKPAGDGTISFHGFFGDYEIGVKTGDEYMVIPASCLKADDGTEIALSLTDAVPEHPKLIGADHNLDGTVVYLYFDKPMSDPSAEASNFILYAVAASTINSASLGEDPSVIELNLASNLHYNNYYSISYLPGNLTSADGGTLEITGPETVPNNIPGCVSAETTVDGTAIELILSEPISDPSGSPGNFEVEVNGDPVEITGVEYKTGYDSVFVISLANPVVNSDMVVRVSYTRGTLHDDDGYLMDDIYRLLVTNNVPSAIQEENESGIQFYPNPFASELIIKAGETGSFDEIALIDINGKEVLHSTTDNTVHYALHTSGLVSGTYQLIVYKNGKVIAKTHVIKE